MGKSIQRLNVTKYSRMDQVKFVEDSLSFTWSILEYFAPNTGHKKGKQPALKRYGRYDIKQPKISISLCSTERSSEIQKGSRIKTMIYLKHILNTL